MSKPKPLTYYKRYGKDESTGFPKDVFLWQTFHGNKEALEAAIANGSVQEYKKDGVQFYSFQTSKTGVESGTNNDLKLRSGQVDLKDNQYKTLSRAFSSLALKLDDSEEEELCNGSSTPFLGAKLW